MSATSEIRITVPSAAVLTAIFLNPTGSITRPSVRIESVVSLPSMLPEGSSRFPFLSAADISAPETPSACMRIGSSHRRTVGCFSPQSITSETPGIVCKRSFTWLRAISETSMASCVSLTRLEIKIGSESLSDL